MAILRTLPQRTAGFTLVELMIGVAILGILAAFAAPSFREMLETQRIKSASFDLIAALTMARSEAIKQNGAVTLTPTSATTEWGAGWTITGPDAAIIGTQGAYSGLTITGTTASIVYNRSGRSSAAVTLQVAATGATSTVARRCITLGLTGQPKSASC